MADEDEIDRQALLHGALGHPVRVAILRVLRQHGKLPLAELRKQVSSENYNVDARNLQFHAYKMQLAGILKVTREGGRDYATLVTDVSLNISSSKSPRPRKESGSGRS